MSIDRGKLLTEIEHEITAMATKVDVTVRLGRASNIMAKVRAIAQPAEAVDGELLNDLEAEALLAWPRGVEQRFVGAREQRIAKLCKRAIAALAHDAAQGAVAKVVGFDRGLPDLEWVNTVPLAKGDNLYTHPQVAPAQGVGMVLVGYVYNNRCVATDESRKEGCLQGEFAQSLPNGTQLFAFAPSPEPQND